MEDYTCAERWKMMDFKVALPYQALLDLNIEIISVTLLLISVYLNGERREEVIIPNRFS